jgi:hypothetical protein
MPNETDFASGATTPVPFFSGSDQREYASLMELAQDLSRRLASEYTAATVNGHADNECSFTLRLPALRLYVAIYREHFPPSTLGKAGQSLPTDDGSKSSAPGPARLT